MPILANVPVTVTAEQMVSALGRGRVRPDLLQDAEEALALGRSLWQPRAVYDWFQVRSVEGDQVAIESESQPDKHAVLCIGPKADLLAPAERVLVSVITIGPALGQRVDELQGKRESLKAYMLDTAGVMAVGAVGAAMRCMAEETAAGLDWGVSPALAPGSLVGWSLRGQRDLCALLPLDSIGVRLNENCVLEPQKSASNLIGLGPNYDRVHVGSVCKYCALSDSCWRRREDPS